MQKCNKYKSLRIINAPCKLVEILDNEQKRKDLQYTDYMNIIRLADYHFFQNSLSNENFSGGVFENRTNYYAFDPIKSSNPFASKSLLSKNIFQDKMIVRKTPNNSASNILLLKQKRLILKQI